MSERNQMLEKHYEDMRQSCKRAAVAISDDPKKWPEIADALYEVSARAVLLALYPHATRGKK